MILDDSELEKMLPGAKTMMEAARRTTCPKCGKRNSIPIQYGLPVLDMFKEAEAGKIKLGGCEVTDNDPGRHCKDCGNEW